MRMRVVSEFDIQESGYPSKYTNMIGRLEAISIEAQAIRKDIQAMTTYGPSDTSQVGKSLAFLLMAEHAATHAAFSLGRTSPKLWE
jgi:hypothetical protein